MIHCLFRDLNFEKEIGANSLSLEVGPFRFVVDAGMDPKRIGNATLPQLSLLPENSVDAILLTHCHLDHLGGLPVLLRKQPKARVFLSYPTSLVTPIMLENSYTVMCRQKEEQSIPEYPLYEKKDIERIKQNFFPVKFGQVQHLEKEGCRVDITFFLAGHVLGASSILIEYEERKIFITGDILFQDQHTLKGANIPHDRFFDTIVLETTRGRTERQFNRTDEEERLLRTIAQTIQRGGMCLIPAFALGRIQELLMLLYNARRGNKIPECPIFCSGLGMALVNVFNEIGKTTNTVHFTRNILKRLNIKSLRRKKIGPDSQLTTPAIYLLSSGMLVEHTPSYRVASNLIKDCKNTVCFVGYCDPDTPGGQLLQTAPDEVFTFKALEFSTPLRAQVEHFDLSGHADRDDLYQFVADRQPKQVILTHGDAEARQWFFEKFSKNCPPIRILDPEVGKTYAI
ncbi:MAG: MBL fold metallo-hydrolase [Puniceicoccales bacterium]|nr:MBL fold metallo-hydrolase [Puniceicoccales bacterium]